MRLGVYADLSYVQDATCVSAPVSFLSWLAAVGQHVDELVIFGRVDPKPGRAAYPASGQNVRFVALPFYQNLRKPAQVLAATPGSLRRLSQELAKLDAVLLFGPHPLSLLFGASARRAGVPVIVGVRQDFPHLVGRRITGSTARWAVPASRVLEVAHRWMAGWGGAVVVGEELARPYRRAGRRTLVTAVSLVRADELVDATDAVERPWPGEHRALTVGRLDPEKNPLLLVDVASALRTTAPWTMVVAGTGPMGGPLEQKAASAGLGENLVQLGHVDGPELRRLYRESTVFIHVSWTEGVPQVLFEAAAAGVPIVATAVGGVAKALDQGTRGMLVVPGDAAAIARAVDRLGADAPLRRSMITAALAWAREETLESQTARLAAFIEEVARDGAPRGDG